MAVSNKDSGGPPAKGPWVGARTALGHRRRRRWARGGRGAARRGAWGAAGTALGHRDRRRRGAREGGIDWGGDTSQDFTKPRQTIQSHQKSIQRHDVFDKTTTYETTTQNIKQESQHILT